MPDIFDLVDARNIATYYTELQSNKVPYLGATLFPAQRVMGLDLKWFKGADGLPVMLAPSNFDAKATTRDRIGVSAIETEMPFFREQMRIGEKDRQEILKVAASSNAAVINPIITKIYNDRVKLIDGSDVVAERMRMQLLSTGKISISANGVKYDYDYRMLSARKVTLTGTDKWSDPTAKVIQQVMGWLDDVETSTGIRPKRAVCTRKTWGYLLKNETIRMDMNPVNGANLIMTDALLKSYLLEKLGLTVAIYNKMYATTVGGASSLFYPDDKFTLIGDGNLGNTYFGTTPEEADLLSGGTNAQTQIVNTGVSVTTWKEIHPVNSITLVAAIVLPSFESIDSTFIATVA